MKSIILISLSIVILLSIGIISPTVTTTIVLAQQTSLDLTTPTAGKLYGGEKKGTLDLNAQNNTVMATAKMNEPPAEGQVYEGWLEDKGDQSGYSLSLGKFNDANILIVNQTMVNPYTYTVFFITAEPIDDSDPKPADVVVGTELPTPFGQ